MRGRLHPHSEKEEEIGEGIQTKEKWRQSKSQDSWGELPEDQENLMEGGDSRAGLCE